MSNPLDTDAGSEMFASYENELKLVQADLNQKLDQISEASGEQRKNAIRQAEQVLDEATELVSPSSAPFGAAKIYSGFNLPGSPTAGNKTRELAH